MTTEIWRDFDPNLDIPIGLKNARISTRPDVVEELPEPDADIDIQEDTLYDDDSQLDEDESSDELDVPGTFVIISQTVRTAPDGSQVVDVVIDVEEVEGAEKYEVRITK
jgi:hypothetical protein